MTQAKLVSLQKYADHLKHRLSSPVPKGQDPQAFIQMLEIDLKKTLARINSGR